jgi:hypothetical protein
MCHGFLPVHRCLLNGLFKEQFKTNVIKLRCPTVMGASVAQQLTRVLLVATAPSAASHLLLCWLLNRFMHALVDPAAFLPSMLDCYKLVNVYLNNLFAVRVLRHRGVSAVPRLHSRVHVRQAADGVRVAQLQDVGRPSCSGRRRQQ